MASAVAKKPQGELVEKSFIHYFPVVLVCILICGVPSAILNSAAGIFYPVMAEDFGVPVSQIAMWRTLDYITGFIITPIAGIMLAKYNAKYIILSCAVVESLVFVLFGTAPSVYVLWIGGAIAGITNAVMLGVSIAVIINRWFRTSVGLIIGLSVAFTGFGGMLFTAIGQSLIDAEGWRYAYIALGIASLVIMTIAVLTCLKNSPEDKGLLPYGTAKMAAKNEVDTDTVVHAPCVRPSVARRSLVFWLMICFGLLINIVCNINAFFASYIVWFNEQDVVVSGAVAAAFVTGAQLTIANSAGNAIGKVGLGFFSDLNLRNTFVLMAACGILGLFFMWQFPNTILLPIGGFLMGCFIAAVLVIVPMFARRVFGEGASYPIIWSNIGMSLGLGGAVGSYIWAFISENMGGYSAVFGLALACMFVLLIIGLVVYAKRDSLPREELREEDL